MLAKQEQFFKYLLGLNVLSCLKKFSENVIQELNLNWHVNKTLKRKRKKKSLPPPSAKRKGRSTILYYVALLYMDIFQCSRILAISERPPFAIKFSQVRFIVYFTLYITKRFNGSKIFAFALWSWLQHNKKNKRDLWQTKVIERHQANIGRPTIKHCGY